MTGAVLAKPPSVKGWCPGSLRPMMSGDGLVVRIKISGGRLDPATLRAIADLGRRCGNGLFDLSHRANLQMRGVSDETLPQVLDALDGLGLLSPDAASEQVLNVIAPPLTGLDGAALIDAHATLAALESILRDDVALHALPGKFGFVIDDGGALSTTSADVDIAIEAVRDAGTTLVALRLAGAPEIAARVAADEAPGAAADLARAFLSLRGRYGARRMRALVAAAGAHAVFAAAGLRSASYRARAGARLSDALGVHLLGAGAFVGCAAPFGRWRAEQLALVADSAAAQGARAVRLTPWRAILVAGLAPEGAQHLIATLADAGLVVDSADPVLSVVACPGAPDCESSSVVTHAPALALASLFAGVAPATRLHVTGCPKGCAHPRPAPFTLVGRNGGFDLVVDGAPDAAPVATGLDAAAAHCEIARRMSQSAPT